MSGNMFSNASAFDQIVVPHILDTVNRVLDPTGIACIPVGSAATPKKGNHSGDMDVIVDQQSVLDFFKSTDVKSARKELSAFIREQGLDTVQSGISVHVNVPVGKSYHQVDIMITENARKIAKFHIHNIPKDSPFKGVNKQLMIAILAKQQGYLWSAWQGLFSRDSIGKKGNFITDDLNKIASLLLGNAASADDLASVESIMNYMPDEQSTNLLARARQDPKWQELVRNCTVL